MSMVMAESTDPIDAFATEGEAAVRDRIKELETEIDRLKASLEDAQKAKQILFLTGDPLTKEVVHFFTDMLSSPAQQADGPGDFWLVADAVGEAWCFGEVQESETGNVTREHLARIMIDRGDAGKSDDFPALLVVNTYCTKETTGERDLPVPEDVRRRAAEDNILVVRTLDLVRLRQKDLSGFPGIKEFLEAVRAGGGWYEVNDALASKVNAA